MLVNTTRHELYLTHNPVLLGIVPGTNAPSYDGGDNIYTVLVSQRLLRWKVNAMATSLYVTVRSVERRNDGSKEYNVRTIPFNSCGHVLTKRKVYIVDLRKDDQAWQIARRYSQFLELHQWVSCVRLLTWLYTATDADFLHPH